MVKKVKTIQIIKREYIIRAKELRELFQLEGEIINITLEKGLTPTEDNEGKTHDYDEYSIQTREEN